MTTEAPVAVVEGPKGTAEIYEVNTDGRTTQYEVRCADRKEVFKSLGEAYIEAGQMVGTKT